MANVYLRWLEPNGDPYQAVHVSVKSAQAQAEVEPNRNFTGIYDGPHEDAKKVADVKSTNEAGG